MTILSGATAAYFPLLLDTCEGRGGPSHPENGWLLVSWGRGVPLRGGPSHPENGWLLKPKDVPARDCSRPSHPENGWLLKRYQALPNTPLRV